MKTTIDIPDPLLKRVKIRAVERGETLREMVLRSLERDLDAEATSGDRPASYWANRKLLPEFARLQAAGAFRPKPGDRDITDLISEERNERLL